MNPPWRIFTCLTIFLYTLATTIDVSLAGSKFHCPSGCDCSISLTIQKNLYDIKCNSLHNIHKFIQYYPKQTEHIRKLNVSNANIKKLNVDVINRLKQLEILDLSNNQLTDLPKPLRLNQLTDIILSHNQISTISYWFFPKSINYIDLTYNSMTELPETILDLPKLERIDIEGNNLKCSCYSRNVYTELLKRMVVFDKNECHMENGEKNSWKLLHLSCSDEQHDEPDGTDIFDEYNMGSGDGEAVNITNDIEDDLDEFISVDRSSDLSTSSESPIPVEMTSPKTLESSGDADDNEATTVKQSENDFYFGEENSTLHTDDLLLAEGSGDVDYSMDNQNNSLIVEHITDNYVSSSTESAYVEYEDESGSGSGDIPVDEDFDSEEMTNSSTSPPPLFIPDISSSEPEPSSTEDPGLSSSSSTTTNDDLIIPVVRVSSEQSKQNELEETTTEREIIQEEIQVKHKAYDTDFVPFKTDTTDTNINEELGQVVDDDSKKQPFGTYIFLAILLAVLICLIGYTMLKRRISKRERTLQNRRNHDDMTNATELKDIDKTVALLNEENEKKKSNGLINETTAMIPNNNSNNSSPATGNNGLRKQSYDGDSSRPVAPDDVTPSVQPNDEVPPRQSTNNNVNQAEKVKITMTELTDSIPKTPVLVTRTKSSAGDQIFVTPNLNQRPNLRNYP